MSTMTAIRKALETHQPAVNLHPGEGHAAVACILCGTDANPKILFIQRTTRKGDPWSGHIAFPGGKVETHDRSSGDAAERETREEIGLDLSRVECLCQLDDVTANIIPVHVSGFVYIVEEPDPFKISDEVHEVFWVSITDLVDPNRRMVFPFQRPGETVRLFPAIDVLGPGKPVLWGITYRFIAKLLNLVGHQLPLSIQHPPT